MNITEGKRASDHAALNDELENILHEFDPISLKEMDAGQLTSRFDEKYVFPAARLTRILTLLEEHYRVLSVNDHRITLYRNTYFDTKDFKSYHDHHNQRANRYKIRFRHYSSSDVCFLEVKRKDNHRLTLKERLQVPAADQQLNAEHNAFLFRSIRELPLSLHQSLRNCFYRITLVNEKSRERVTLDTQIHFMNGRAEKKLHHVAIAEVKHERHYSDSVFKKLMTHERIFPMRISKYCIGMLLTNPQVKQNRFKRKLLTLKKYFDDFA